MEVSNILQIPSTIEECINLTRSYIYIDKFTAEVTIREISPFLAPGFILGLCSQIPFLYEFVEPYINSVASGAIYEVQPSDQYKHEMLRNIYINSQLLYFEYTPTDCDFVLSVLLTAVVHSMYGRPNHNFKSFVADSVKNITTMAGIYPMAVYFPPTFRHIMKTTLIAVPELRIRMMALLCQNGFSNKGSIWSLIKRYIWIQIRNFHMGTFVAIGDWYEAREKTLAHADPEVVDEMKNYEKISNKIKAIAAQQGYGVGTFRILNPQSMLPYLRQFPASAYCAVEWKKKNDKRWLNYHMDLDKFGVDTKSLDRLLAVPVKHTLKRKLTDIEIDTISSKRFKELETEYTADDDSDVKNENDGE